MLTQTEMREMRDLVTRVQRGSVSRRDWAQLAAYALIAQGAEVVTAIADGGYARFKATSEPVYAGHAFHESEFRRIYQRVCDAVPRAARAIAAAH